MAQPFKLHSLSKQVEATKKAPASHSQHNHLLSSRTASKINHNSVHKSTPDIFGARGDDNSSDSDTSSSGSSDKDGGSQYLNHLKAQVYDSSIAALRNAMKTHKGNPPEIADSDEERQAAKSKLLMVTQAGPNAKGSKIPNGKQLVKHETELDTSSEKDLAEISFNASKTVGDQLSDLAAAKEKKDFPDSESTSSDSETSEESEEEDGDDDDESDKEMAKSVASGSSSGEDMNEDEEMVDESIHMADRRGRNEVALPKYVSSDFMLRRNDDSANGQDVAKVCDQAIQQGKQFWYFTLPSNVPISVIQNMEIPMGAGTGAQSTFSHNEEDYGISFDEMTPKSSIQILIPSTDSSQYRPSSQPVNQIMQVKKVTRVGLPSANTTTSMGPAPKPSPRPQPKGLKVRFQPIGVNTPMGSIGFDDEDEDEEQDHQEDDEMGEDVPEPSSMTLMTSTKRDKKRSRNKSAEDGHKKSSKKKKKPLDTTPDPTAPSSKLKRKTGSLDDDAFAASQQLMQENDHATGTSKKKQKKQKSTHQSSPELGSERAMPTKKHTPVLPPTINKLSSSFDKFEAGLKADATTPTPAGKSNKKVKMNNKGQDSKAFEGTGSSAAKKETQVPLPKQHNLLPTPSLSSHPQPKMSPVPLPTHGSPSPLLAPSSQPKMKNGQSKVVPEEYSSRAKKVTPVPLPFNGTS